MRSVTIVTYNTIDESFKKLICIFMRGMNEEDEKMKPTCFEFMKLSKLCCVKG